MNVNMNRVNMKLLVAEFIAVIGLMALVLFVPAGTIAWPAGWVYITLFGGGFIVVSLWLLKANPDLLRERMGRLVRSDQKPWDKIWMPAFQVLTFAWVILIALDAARYHWSQVPSWLQFVGVILLLGAYSLFFLTFRENTYLSTVVRIQKERGHKVIDTGPYRYVRHPMYVGMILFFIGTPLLLGSWYGLIGGLTLIVILARRAVLEERMLRNELPGYEAYMQKVKFRFVPRLW